MFSGCPDLRAVMDLYQCSDLFKILITTSGVVSLAALSKALPSEKCLKLLTAADIWAAAGEFECSPMRAPRLPWLCLLCYVKALQTWVQAVLTPSDPPSLCTLTAWGRLHRPGSPSLCAELHVFIYRGGGRFTLFPC